MSTVFSKGGPSKATVRSVSESASPSPGVVQRLSIVSQESLHHLLGKLHRFRRAPEPARADVRSAIPATLLAAEIEVLPEAQCLVTSGQFRVHYARADQIPWCLQEIGRLRESAFRAVGEGTGKAVDLDAYDQHYIHLFVWDPDAKMIVGSYRMGLADEILERFGEEGLYTHSLFRYSPRALQAMNPAIELGRSFVRPEYQRSYAPLMLLWRGIGTFIQRNPRYAVLFGAVSISNSYDPASRQLIVDYLRANTIEKDLARYVRSRRPFASRFGFGSRSEEIKALKDVEQLSRVVSRIEPDEKGVPILLKQYLKLGGRLLGFNTDPDFSDALDGLMKVDLRNSEPRALARYMGEEGARTFLAYHAQQPEALPRAS
jgi:putative hemolysin